MFSEAALVSFMVTLFSMINRWQRRIRSNIDSWRVILMTPAEAATGRK